MMARGACLARRAVAPRSYEIEKGNDGLARMDKKSL